MPRRGNHSMSSDGSLGYNNRDRSVSPVLKNSSHKRKKKVQPGNSEKLDRSRSRSRSQTRNHRHELSKRRTKSRER